MRRKTSIFAAMAAAVAMTFALAGVAMADGGPHGGYGGQGVRNGATAWANTDKCAGCHRAHTGENTYLLTAEEEQLCKSCHEAGKGAGTDVWAGQYRSGTDGTVGKALNGGGFDQSVTLTGSDRSFTNFASTTSKHDVGGAGLVALGGGYPGSTTAGYGFTGDLECSSCHNPHGSGNYRILNAKPAEHGSTDPNGSWVTGAPMQADAIVLSPEIPASATKNYTAGQDTAYDRGISDFCASCHTNYLWTRSNGGAQQYDWNNDGTLETTWRHAVASKNRYDWNGTSWVTATGADRTSSGLNPTLDWHLRGAQPDGGVAPVGSTTGRLTCLTCHNAHGTSAVETGYASDAGVVGGSSLLFLDNRGVCQNCHGK